MSRRARRRPRRRLTATSVNASRSVLSRCGHHGWGGRSRQPPRLVPGGQECAGASLFPGKACQRTQPDDADDHLTMETGASQKACKRGQAAGCCRRHCGLPCPNWRHLDSGPLLAITIHLVARSDITSTILLAYLVTRRSASHVLILMVFMIFPAAGL